jgi:hypothetical protein
LTRSGRAVAVAVAVAVAYWREKAMEEPSFHARNNPFHPLEAGGMAHLLLKKELWVLRMQSFSEIYRVKRSEPRAATLFYKICLLTFNSIQNEIHTVRHTTLKFPQIFISSIFKNIRLFDISKSITVARTFHGRPRLQDS